MRLVALPLHPPALGVDRRRQRLDRRHRTLPGRGARCCAGAGDPHQQSREPRVPAGDQPGPEGGERRLPRPAQQRRGGHRRLARPAHRAEPGRPRRAGRRPRRARTVRIGAAAIGLVGPMSNYVSPPQLIADVPYRDLDEMHAFARRWRDEHRGRWFTAAKLSGFCLLMKRAVYEAVGGLDERFGLGFFDDDDLAVRRGGPGSRWPWPATCSSTTSAAGRSRATGSTPSGSWRRTAASSPRSGGWMGRSGSVWRCSRGKTGLAPGTGGERFTRRHAEDRRATPTRRGTDRKSFTQRHAEDRRATPTRRGTDRKSFTQRHAEDRSATQRRRGRVRRRRPSRDIGRPGSASR